MSKYALTKNNVFLSKRDSLKEVFILNILIELKLKTFFLVCLSNKNISRD